MPNTRGLSVLAYANGFTLWHCRAREAAIEAVSAPGYFAEFADMLAEGDMIMVTSPSGAGIFCVTPAKGLAKLV